MLRDLELDLGSGQGHITAQVTSTHTSTYTGRVVLASCHNHVTAATRSTEICPFECREIWT